MSAAELLLTRCAEQGVTLTAEAGRLRVAGPAEAVREFTPLLREHRAELLALLAKGPEPDSGTCRAEGASRPPAPAGQGTPELGAASDRTCTACAHRTRAGTCGEPVLAGLADHFAIRWPPAGHATRCAAFERQQATAAEPLRHPYETERQAWTPADEREIKRMAATFERAVALGLTPDEADYVADVQHWGRRVGDARRLCAECRPLRAGASSRWWCAAQRLPLPQQLVAEQPHRCPIFRDAFE